MTNKTDDLVVLPNTESHANIFVHWHVGSFQPSVQVFDASSATSKVGMPHPSAQQHGVNSSTHASSEQVFNDTIASHLEFPYFFSASSRARVATLEPGNHRRVPPPSLDQPSGCSPNDKA